MTEEIKREGFFTYATPEQRRELGRIGGKRAQEKRSGHRWSTDEARAAGSKGGSTTQRRKKEREATPKTEVPS